METSRTGAECVGVDCRAGLLVGVVAVSSERVLSAVASEREKEAEGAESAEEADTDAADAEADAEV